MNIKCSCFICQNQNDFDMPVEIVDAAIKGNLVLFAGAGISTESRIVYPTSLYESVLKELRLKNKKCSFPKLMEIYCSKPDGRKRLLQKIKERIDYVYTFPMLHNLASMFLIFPRKSGHNGELVSG